MSCFGGFFVNIGLARKITSFNKPGKHQALLLAVVCILVAEGQNNRRQNRRQNRRPNNRQNNRQNNRGQFGRNGVTRNGARDARGTEVYPGCSGKVCLPEAQLCAERKQKVRFLKLKESKSNISHG